ncbi:hypothetical protein GCL60_10910 [Silvanigrella paludirubra]|uniref:Uncharacterized protein n=1 Tax=Silvanigrella paludirubra TaxID=2499159 RepID=A0A6N6VSK7_9BACT|nr:hypothetical protein [Silvanigrella paludirubra]KAB8037676.1 hypothetical protein GCL60_10910 [Silvanigrella paludirubra]
MWKVNDQLEKKILNLYQSDFKSILYRIEKNKSLFSYNLLKFIWNYSYAIYSLNTKSIWSEVLEKVDDLLNDHQDMNTFTDEIENDANPTWNHCYDLLVSKKFKNQTLFNAMNSKSLKLKKLVINEAKKVFRYDKKIIFNELKDNIIFKDIEIDFIYNNLNKIIPKKLLKNPPNINKNIYIYINIYENILKKMYEEWHLIYLQLKEKNFMDINTDSSEFRLQAAYAIPMGKNHTPLCFIHSVKNFNSLRGCIHEISHCIHFYSYKDKNNAIEIPNYTSVEVFPMFMELVFIFHLDKEYFFTFIHKQLKVYLKFFLFKNKVKKCNSLKQANKLWRKLNNKKSFWYLEKTIFLEDNLFNSYLIGAFWSSICAIEYLINGNKDIIIKINSILKEDPREQKNLWFKNFKNLVEKNE